MKEPGTFLLTVARRLCHPRSFERVALPAIADLQAECRASRIHEDGRGAWRRRLSGTLRVMQALLLQAIFDLFRGPDSVAEPEISGARLTRVSLATFAICWIALAPWGLLSLPAELAYKDRFAIGLYCLPAWAVTFLPASFFAGALLMLRHGSGLEKETRRRSRSTMLRFSTALAVATFILAGWAMPIANQSARERTFLAVTGLTLTERGAREMSLTELSRAIDTLQPDQSGLDTRYRLERHRRFALPAASLVWAALALGFARRSAARGLGPSLILALGLPCLHFYLLRLGEVATNAGPLTPLLGAWLANLMLVFGALVLLASRPEFRPTSR